ncbi:MAG: hypothetical protein ACLPKB_24420 [Xanthobacteraceae bacterium]
MRVLAIILFSSLVVGGCASVPPGPNPNVIEREIVKSSLSELCAAVLNIKGMNKDPKEADKYFSSNDGWIASIETSLRTDAEASVSPSVTLVGPVIPGLLIPKGGTAGSYNVAAGGTIDSTATSLRDAKHYLVLESLLTDPELCPESRRQAYLNEGAEYQSDGKYLSGKLGIRDWLYNTTVAHNFGSLIDPTTQVVESPVPNIASRVAAKYFLAKPQRNRIAPVDYSKCQVLTKVDPANPMRWPLGGSFCFRLDPRLFNKIPQNGNTKYSKTINWDPPPPPPPPPATPPAHTDPKWLTFDNKGAAFVACSIPTSAPGFSSITVTATNSGDSQEVRIPISFVAAPKTTTWGPVYYATFTFIIKATGSVGPSFTLDRAKAGGPTLFSSTRTETNFVTISLTSTGVPLTEFSACGQAAPSDGLTQDAITNAIYRLDDAGLRSALSHVIPPSP